MNTRAFLKTALAVVAVSLAFPAARGPLDQRAAPDMTAARIVLASLHRDLEVPALPNQTPRISAPDLVQDAVPDKTPLMQVAGRCGSSNKYCDSPGLTYCCGNSTDGFYCAANVNGCTR